MTWTLKMKQLQCVFCRLPAEGNFSVPNRQISANAIVPLCDACGSQQVPLLQHIWHAIARGYYVTTYTDEVVVGCAKCGQLCKLVNPTTTVYWRCYTCKGAEFTIPHFAEMAASVRDALTVARMRHEMQLTRAEEAELNDKLGRANVERINAPWRF